MWLIISQLNKNCRPLLKISPSPLQELRLITFYLKSTNLTTQVDPSFPPAVVPPNLFPAISTKLWHLSSKLYHLTLRTAYTHLKLFRDFNFLDQNKLIFTMDIKSLYTVIPNDEGLLALKHFFDHRTVEEPSSETLLRLTELVLTLNCFSFGGNYYKQTNGVAMGIKMGPSYANLFVGFIEH